MEILTAIFSFHWYFSLNAKSQKLENDSYEFPPTSCLPESSFALFGNFEVVTYNGL